MEYLARSPSNLEIMVAGQHEILAAQLRRLGFTPTLTRLEALEHDPPSSSSRHLFLIVCPDAATGAAIVRGTRLKQQEAGIIAAARDLSTQAEVALLEAGADRCLPLPAESTLVGASINALTRRLLRDWSPHGDGVHLGAESGVLRIGWRVVELRKTEYQVCEYLVVNRGRWVTERELLQNVLGMKHDRETSLVRVHIRHIRQALGDMRGCLISKRGHGYQFCPSATRPPWGSEHAEKRNESARGMG
jgi:two-component system, OmpR family, response regulator